MSDRSFPKRERLCSRSDIDLLFREGNTLRSGPMALRWMLKSGDREDSQVKVLISVPKRRVRNAVDRNRIKRRLREIYRLNKGSIPLCDGKMLLMALIYGGKPEISFGDLEKNYLHALKSLVNAIRPEADRGELNKN